MAFVRLSDLSPNMGFYSTADSACSSQGDSRAGENQQVMDTIKAKVAEAERLVSDELAVLGQIEQEVQVASRGLRDASMAYKAVGEIDAARNALRSGLTRIEEVKSAIRKEDSAKQAEPRALCIYTENPAHQSFLDKVHGLAGQALSIAKEVVAGVGAARLRMHVSQIAAEAQRQTNQLVPGPTVPAYQAAPAPYSPTTSGAVSPYPSDAGAYPSAPQQKSNALGYVLLAGGGAAVIGLALFLKKRRQRRRREAQKAASTPQPQSAATP